MTDPQDQKPARPPFEKPRLVSHESWTLANITANIGGFFSDNSKGRSTPVRRVRRMH